MVASVAAVGLLTDRALDAGDFGLAAAMNIVVGAALLVSAGRLTRAEPRLLALLAALFGAWLVLRASPWLLWPDLIAAVGFLGLASTYARAGSLLDIGTAEVMARAINAIGHVMAGAGFIARPVLSIRGRVSALGPVARGLLIALPICGLLAGLLASADPVFASFFKLNIDLGHLLADVGFAIIGALAMAGVLRLASAEPVAKVDGPSWRLGATEALVVLALLDAVFAAFAVAQLLAASGAATATLKSVGVTYSDYARSGFFQLLWVGGITLFVLILFSRITGLSNPEHKWAFRVLCAIAIALTLMIVVVAFRRLSLYEDAYGFTMLRLYSHIFAGWLAVVFLLLATEVLGFRARRRWFVGATVASATVVLLALNLVNPEAVVVALNIDHAQASHKIDALYLQELSSDATPALLQSAMTLKIACEDSQPYQPTVWAFNLSESNAAQARAAACP